MSPPSERSGLVSPPSERGERWGEYGEAGRGASSEPPPALPATSPNVASLLGEETIVA